MSESITFEGVSTYIDIVKLINNLKKTARRTYNGSVLSSNKDKMIALLINLEAHIPSTSSLFPNYDEEDGEITLKLPSFYNFSLEEMLSDHPELRNNFISEPTYFEDIDFLYRPVDINQIDLIENNIIKNYIQCVNLFLLIKSQTDHITTTTTNEEKLYFLGGKKLIIINDLTSNNEVKLTSIIAFKTSYIESQIHKEAIKQIIKDSFISYYSTLSEVSINQICKDFDNIYDVIKNNYETYISEFTFSKIKREVEKFRTETITRINKALSDIQMQIVTIPASVIIVAANFKTAKDFSFKTNSVILFGALFFSIAVYYICENQKDTLKNIKHEVDSHKKELEKNPLFLQDTEINNNYTFIYQRYQRQRDNLHKIKIGVFFSIALTIFIYLAINAEYSCLNYNLLFLEAFKCSPSK